MRAFLKWLRRAVLAVVVLVTAGAASGYLWLRGSLPQIDGERAAYGLDAPVEVVRDRNGVPHILARSEEDALFALGFVHAQDRLWQMEMNRRIGAGRLAEVLGAPALGTDRLLRVLGLYRRATAALAHLAPDARRRIDAYVNGVNARLETRTGPLPPEFLILGFEPEPWTAADTAVWAKVMALDLGREWARDLMRLRMADFLAPDRILDFYTPYREDKPRDVILPGTDPSSPAAPAGGRDAPGAGYEPLPDPERAPPRAERAAPSDRGPDREGSHPGRGRTPRREAPPGPAPGTDLAHVRAPLPAANVHAGADADPPGGAHPSPRPGGFTLRPRSGHPGSNSWAVSGARSASGRPLLANDPHLGLSVPSVWYLAHLSWPGRDVVGATFPGMPVVVLGHNGRAAWGLTNTGADTQDLYLEKLDPSNPARYLTPDGYRRFEVHHEEIEVKDSDEVVLRVRETRHGPVLDDASAAAAGASPPGHVLALGWTALRDDDRTLEAGLGLPEAGDWPSFVANFERFHSPPQNVAYADVDGDIGFLVAGADPGPAARGAGPCPARNGSAVGLARRPRLARLHPFRRAAPGAQPPGRGRRRRQPRGDRPRLPVPVDVSNGRPGYRGRADHGPARLSDPPRRVQLPLPPAGSGLALRPRPAAPASPGPARTAGGAARSPCPARSSTAGTATWTRAVRSPSSSTPGSGSSAASRAPTSSAPCNARRGAARERSSSESSSRARFWCDDVGTERPETCDDVLARALERAVRRVAKRQGDDPAAWRWGEEHIALAEHRPLASSPLAFLFNLRGPAPGSVYSVNSFEFSPLDSERPFASTHGPSLRAIYDLADLDGSLFIHSTGQSGNVLSPLYDSFEERWRNGEYVTIPHPARSVLRTAALGRLRLVPR